MNIQDNAQKSSSSSDYYKELKSVKKEIDKIYKQLTIDESLSDIINNIQNDLSKNITFILTNLSKPKSSYKEFNTKIMKIIYLLIELLTNFTVITSINIEKYRATFTADYKVPLESINFPTIIDGDIINNNIMKIILTLEYYYEHFEKNIVTTDNKQKIEELTTKLISNKDSTSGAIKDIKLEDELKKLLEYTITEVDKEKYINVLNYIQVTSFQIFEYVDSRYTKLKELEKEKEKDAKSKSVEKNADLFVENFKKEIYYNFIANNSSGLDSESQLFENGNEKVELEARKDLLVKMKEQLDKQLNYLNGIIKFLIDSDKQEYLKEITDIKKEFKDYVKEKEYSDNILTILVNEEGELKKQLDKNAINKKIFTDKAEQDRMKLQRDIDIGARVGPRGGRRNKMSGGEQKTSKYYEEKYKALKNLLNAIDNLINKIAEIEGKDDDKDPFSKKKGMFGDTDNDYNSIYNNIWKDYKKEMNKIKSKGVTLESLKQDNRLYERVKENNLDPQDVLKITFLDKVIFICIILIIRTFAMVLIELLIEYNIVSTLNRGIFVYSIIYLLLLLTGVLIINYDSYKLRILVNYLNIHINSSNIFFHALLFCLFIGLILIIINDEDNNLKSIDNIFNYTYVYKYIYEIAEKSNPMSNLLLSQKEKLKLQYRMDIITMIIFIFSSLLILIM